MKRIKKQSKSEKSLNEHSGCFFKKAASWI
jgi:hypothetical protein